VRVIAINFWGLCSEFIRKDVVDERALFYRALELDDSWEVKATHTK